MLYEVNLVAMMKKLNNYSDLSLSVPTVGGDVELILEGTVTSVERNAKNPFKVIYWVSVTCLGSKPLLSEVLGFISSGDYFTVSLSKWSSSELDISDLKWVNAPRKENKIKDYSPAYMRWSVFSSIRKELVVPFKETVFTKYNDTYLKKKSRKTKKGFIRVVDQKFFTFKRTKHLPYTFKFRRRINSQIARFVFFYRTAYEVRTSSEFLRSEASFLPKTLLLNKKAFVKRLFYRGGPFRADSVDKGKLLGYFRGATMLSRYEYKIPAARPLRYILRSAVGLNNFLFISLVYAALRIANLNSRHRFAALSFFAVAAALSGKSSVKNRLSYRTFKKQVIVRKKNGPLQALRVFNVRPNISHWRLAKLDFWDRTKKAWHFAFMMFEPVEVELVHYLERFVVVADEHKDASDDFVLSYFSSFPQHFITALSGFSFQTYLQWENRLLMETGRFWAMYEENFDLHRRLDAATSRIVREFFYMYALGILELRAQRRIAGTTRAASFTEEVRKFDKLLSVLEILYAIHEGAEEPHYDKIRRFVRSSPNRRFFQRRVYLAFFKMRTYGRYVRRKRIVSRIYRHTSRLAIRKNSLKRRYVAHKNYLKRVIDYEKRKFETSQNAP